MQAPIFIHELELTDSIPAIELPERTDGQRYNGVYLLVRLQHEPVGYAFLQPDDLDPAEIAQAVWEQLGSQINAYYAQAGLPAVDMLPIGGLPVEAALATDFTDRPLITVVVCTRDRPESIMATLRSLTATHYRPLEVIVVDNAPTSEATKEAVFAAYANDSRIRYVREPRPGLSCARNRGIAEATADIITFTDDDVTVDPWWLDGILRGFGAAPDVACVTGMIATAQLENPMQMYFHLRANWGSGCERRIFDLVENRDDSPLFPYYPGIFGAGANFAVTRALMKEIGEFNEALGAGTASGGGEDLEIFMRIILSGHRIVYEPAAIVYHYHRTELTDLTDQMYRYGSGCTAALTSIVMRSPRARRELPARLLHGARRIITLNDRVKDNPALPKGLMTKEAWGLLAGPGLYISSRRKLRRPA